MKNISSKEFQTIVIVMAVAGSMIVGAFFVLGIQAVPTAYSQQSAALSSNPTIKVTGDAKSTISPDQATLVINVQSQPNELTIVLEEQQSKIDEVIKTVNTADKSAIVSVGQRSINPYYSGSGIQPSSDVTFNVYSSVAVRTDIDHLSDLVNALAEAGFGFESVYVDPIYYEKITQSDVNDGESDSEESDIKNPITIGISLNTKPDVLSKAVEEYEEKYRSLLSVLEEQSVSEDQISQNNFNIYPLYYGGGQVTSYQAYTQVVVKTDPKNIDAITNAAIQIDKAFVESVVISVSDESIDKARSQLTQEAITNAQQRASEMIEPLGLEINGIKSIEANTFNTPNPYGGEIVYRGVTITPSYYYQPIVGDLSVSITVEFELEQK